MNIDELERAIDGLRKGLQNDGADLVIDNINDDHIEIRLILKEHACRECIVGRDVLIILVETALRQVVPAHINILLNDPR